MAEVSTCFIKGARDFALKIRNQNQLKYLDHGIKSAMQTTSSSVGLLSGYVGLNEGFRKTVKTAKYIGHKYGHKPRVYSLCNKRQSLSNATFGGSLMSSLYSRRVWAHGQCVFVREYGNNGERTQPLYKTKTGYYDVLEVMPTATQAQIKTAYYKQSFIYHPDRNSGGEEANLRFSDITEAYTVLGNKVLRKKYDRGLLSLHDLTAGHTESPPSNVDPTKDSRTTRADTKRSFMESFRGQKPYDFDKFVKSHYGEQLQKERDDRIRKEESLMEREKYDRGWKMGDRSMHVVTCMVVLAIVLANLCKFN